MLKNFFHIEEGFILHLTASMLAGVITATAANPFDMIKSRYMSDKVNAYKNPIDCAIKSYRQDGASVFLKGESNSFDFVTLAVGMFLSISISIFLFLSFYFYLSIYLTHS